tara:strand:- start:83 stop:544 length:462 start_codon:yes stop_codon:yes gene_type:complete
MLKDLMKMKMPFGKVEMVVLALYVAFLITYKMKIPSQVSNLVDSVYGNVLVILVFGVLYMQFNPMVGIVGLLVAYELIRRSTNSVVVKEVVRETQSEQQKISDMKEMNKDQQVNNPPTLEEETVEKVKDFAVSKANTSSVEPLLHDLHNATNL